MRVLVVGAGAVGGYFGGRLAEKGADVTFLVRERRKRQLDENGLIIKSVHGDANLKVKTILAGEKAEPFDLILLSVKAYHLESGLDSFSPYVGEQTVILPLLNGIRHMDLLIHTFGENRVLGGLCFIEATLNSQGGIEQYSQNHDLVFGEWNEVRTARAEAIQTLFTGANMKAKLSDEIRLEMWQKYIFISAMSGMTCLMRSSIGPIFETDYGTETYNRLLTEIVSIARAHEPRISAEIPAYILKRMETLNPTMKSSMLRDMEKGLPVETDHFHGHLIRIAPPDLDLPLLKAVYNALNIYQKNRQT